MVSPVGSVWEFRYARLPGFVDMLGSLKYTKTLPRGKGLFMVNSPSSVLCLDSSPTFELPRVLTTCYVEVALAGCSSPMASLGRQCRRDTYKDNIRLRPMTYCKISRLSRSGHLTLVTRDPRSTQWDSLPCLLAVLISSSLVEAQSP